MEEDYVINELVPSSKDLFGDENTIEGNTDVIKGKEEKIKEDKLKEEGNAKEKNKKEEERMKEKEAMKEEITTKEEGTDEGQFTEPEILEGAEDGDIEGGSEKNDVRRGVSGGGSGHQKVEQVTATSSENESDTPERARRGRRRGRGEDGSRARKARQIQEVLASSPLDLEALRNLAISDGGLVTDELRRKAWPRLMMLEAMEVRPKPPLAEVKAHKDYNQVVLDVNRSLKRFPPGIDDEYRVVLMDQLTTLIIRILTQHPELHYYQGFHDVAITFLLVMGEDVGYEMVENLSVTHLSEFMRPTMEKTTYYLTYIYPILRRADEKLYQFILDSGVGTVFCLPWLITWFAHTLSDYRNVVRLYDYFLASPYLMPMYIAAAIVLHKRQDVLEGECDMAMQHYILSQVPDSLPLEELLVEATRLYGLYPPDSLQQEVHVFLNNRAEQERQEKQRILERRRRFEAGRRGAGRYTGIIMAVSRYIPAHRHVLVRVAFFALTAYLATSAYSYYSNSAIVYPFAPRR